MKHNKKYNKMKGALAFARLGLKDLAVWHDEKSDAEYTSEIINYKRCRSIDIGLSMVNAIIKVKHKWNIHLIAIGHEKFAARNTLTNVAWLAVPNGDSITTEQVESVISYKDAW